jgi:hypothetical protein
MISTHSPKICPRQGQAGDGGTLAYAESIRGPLRTRYLVREPVRIHLLDCLCRVRRKLRVLNLCTCALSKRD